MSIGPSPVLLSLYALSGLITMFVLSRILGVVMPATFQPVFPIALAGAQDFQGVDQVYKSPINTQVNDLQHALNSSGVYGFVFNTSQTPVDIDYDTYNWCNMPHVRKDEYVVPPAEYELKFVEVIHRHHKRESQEA